MSPITGGCLCGAVRFSAAPPTLFCCHCHCAWCRKAHGAAFVTWFGVPAAAFSLPSAETLRWYASSAESERGFCSRCGSTLFFRSRLAPGEVHVALACADGPIDREPTAHIFSEAAVPWVQLGDALPRLDREHRALVR